MKVFVIIPVFNVENYLCKCLDSVFNQTCNKIHNIVPICINDGSTDNSLEILNRYKILHNELIIINKPNGGLSSARNAGLNYISNDNNSFVIFLDSDDYIKNDYIERLLFIQSKTNADIVVSYHINLSENGNHDDSIRDGNVTVLDKFEAVKALFSGEIHSHGPCKLYRTSVWKNIRYDENIHFMEDQRLEFKVFLNANIIVTVNYSGYFYLHRIGSLCQSKMTNTKIIDALESYIYTYNYQYKEFTYEKANLIRGLILNQFACIYLMMFPRFNKKSANSEELKRWLKIKDFEKKYKCVLNYKNKSIKEQIKKSAMILMPHLYRPLFSLFLKKYDK